MPIIKLLAGRPWIDGRGDNYDGACAFNMISPDFDAYLNEHDKIRGLVDPTYVVADPISQIQLMCGSLMVVAGWPKPNI
ncbi:4204_t:CDS:2 [Paraglomus occultum]|uniref:4204_t:CDS:1 n=1 Tax=Paraglomus occultum TaxID=144539 RepID=A0A9N9BQL3_9GLOM|nr:4204_t:CDS:2 [Paraglomus occultum]